MGNSSGQQRMLRFKWPWNWRCNERTLCEESQSTAREQEREQVWSQQVREFKFCSCSALFVENFIQFFDGWKRNSLTIVGRAPPQLHCLLGIPFPLHCVFTGAKRRPPNRTTMMLTSAFVLELQVSLAFPIRDQRNASDEKGTGQDSIGACTRGKHLPKCCFDLWRRLLETYHLEHFCRRCWKLKSTIFINLELSSICPKDLRGITKCPEKGYWQRKKNTSGYVSRFCLQISVLRCA